ncbi:MAG: hypothetical protein KGM43_02715 [Planctomycetota bacterium]|nr:hypothetical protein [Planctomycetota bacterium]
MSTAMLVEDAGLSTSRADTHANFGPQTAAGKQRSRVNAATHGLSNDGPVAAEMLDEARFDEWIQTLKPQGEQQLNLVRIIAHNAARIELCQARETELTQIEQVESREAWDVKRTAEVMQLAKKLRRQPALTIALLKQSLHGCNYLIARWDALARAYLNQNLIWTGSQRRTALDLLGVELDVRPAEWLFIADSNQSKLDVHLEVAAREIRELSRLRDEHLAVVDDHVRRAAARGFAAATSREIRLTRRYEADAHKRMATALASLATLQAAVGPGLEEPRAQTLAEPVAEPAPTATPESSSLDANATLTEVCVVPEFVSESSAEPVAAEVEAAATSVAEAEASAPVVPSSEPTPAAVKPEVTMLYDVFGNPWVDKHNTRRARRKQNEMRMALRKKGRLPAEPAGTPSRGDVPRRVWLEP